MSQSGAITSSGGGGGTVTSVSGTLNRITSTGGNTPVIDIAATYVGQTSLTTLGTITTGVWQGTAVDATHGGTAQTSWTTGDILYASAANTLSKLAAGSNTQILTLAAGVPSWAAPATSGTVTSVSGTANRITSTGGATPVIDISAAYVGQSSITTLGTITTGVWNGTTIDVAHGGTGAVTLTNHGVLIGQATSAIVATSAGTAGQVLQSGGGAADPLYSTSTYPSTNATGDIIYGSATNILSKLAIATIPGVNLEYDGTNVAWFNPLQETRLFDDWITSNSASALNWRNGVVNAGVLTLQGASVDSAHPGIVTSSSAATSNGQTFIMLGQNSSSQPMFLGGGALTMIWVLRIPTASTVAETFTVTCGLSTNQSGSTGIGTGVGFTYTDSGAQPNWQIICKDAGGTDQKDSGIVMTANTWYSLQLDVNAAATSVSFKINGVATSNSPITTHIPTANSLAPWFSFAKTVGSTNRTCDVDAFYMYQKLTSAR